MLGMIKCPHCQSCQRQTKFGFTRFHSQRYRCAACARIYTPSPKPQGHPAKVRQEAVRYSLEGLSQRKIARLLDVSPQSVANWLYQGAAALQNLQAQGHMPVVPPELAAHSKGVMEQDELYTFCNAKRAQKNKKTGEKKTKSTRPAGSI